MKTAFTFLILVCSSIASPLARRYAYGFNETSCSAEQITMVNNALEDMQMLAIDAAHNANPATGHEKAMKAWFGSEIGQSNHNNKIFKRFQAMSSFKSNVPVHPITWDCNREASCCSTTRGVVACQKPKGDEYIHLCPNFWNWHQKARVYDYAGPTGLVTDAIQNIYWPVGALLMHELWHALYGANDTVMDIKDQFNDKTITSNGYGHLACLRFALMDPAKARINADCYSLFATASYFGMDNFALDPMLLTSI